MDTDAAKRKLAARFNKGKSGKVGGMRRKKKVSGKAGGSEEKKVLTAVKRLNPQLIPAIEEVNMFQEDGNVMHFKGPKVQTVMGANTFVIQGAHESKTADQLMRERPDIMQQLAGGNQQEMLQNLMAQLQQQQAAASASGGAAEADDGDDLDFEATAAEGGGADE